MRCPFCGNEETQVKDSRSNEEGAAIRRRRFCSVCGGRFTTFERVQLRELVVVKKSGRKVPFDRDKLMHSIQVALRKRPFDPDKLDRMVAGIVRQLEQAGEPEVASEAIGQKALEALKVVDDVAYVRFASVYMNFGGRKDFEALIEALSPEDASESEPLRAG